ncbi:MAG: hypothetical protein M5U30_04100 [Burkholderiaceae bacterium]|nr:hypothetical protein [Burkholderiaceae bacterium]
MGDGIGDVAAGAPKVHRHAIVAVDGQDEQQLLQIGPVVFAVAVGDRRCPTSANAASRGCAVLPAKGDRSRVVVQPIEAHAEASRKRDDDLGQQCRPVHVEQALERPSDAVVGEVRQVGGAQAEQAAGERHRGLLLAVDRLALDDDRAQQHAQRLRVRNGGAVRARIAIDVLLEDLEHAAAIEEVVEQG